MSETICPKKFLEEAKNIPVIDVRSPKEFAQGHIPGAINIPLFDNDERAAVGTAYKKQSKNKAILLGLDYVGPKMSSFVKQCQKLAVEQKILVHCWRGGMRSNSFAWLLETAGLKVKLLEGGYKAYRHFIREAFTQPAKICILSGYTGSGKTEILHEMAQKGQQIIDLEGLAHHKGSAFGALEQPPQPTTEQFENETAALWLTLNLEETIWVEDESSKIGRAIINENLFHQMRSAPVLKIEIPTAERVKRLVKEYGTIAATGLLNSVEHIQKRLGGDNYKACCQAINENEMSTAISLVLNYYDQTYQFGLNKREKEKITVLTLKTGNALDNAQKIIDFAQSKLSA